MPEPAESGPKVSELMMGVVDLFGILLPGAVITFGVVRLLSLEGLVESGWKEGARGWAVFLVVSYIAGHVVSALGSFLLDTIYDRIYKLHGPPNYNTARARAAQLVKIALGPFFVNNDNILEWSEAFLRLGSPSSAAAIDRLEADSKFFRSLTVVLILAWPIYVLSFSLNRTFFLAALLPLLPPIALCLYAKYGGPEPWDLEKKKKHILNGAAKCGAAVDPIKGRFREAISEARREMPSFQNEADAEYNANHELSQNGVLAAGICSILWLASLVIFALVLARCYQDLFNERVHSHGYWAVIASVVGYSLLTLLSASRYMERRLKRTILTYKCVIALFTVPPILSPEQTPVPVAGSSVPASTPPLSSERR